MSEREERMKPVLDRIPDEWGKYLPGPGWDDLLLDLDSRLAEIDPSYTILQAKQKFGTLRVYFGTTRHSIEQNDRMRELVMLAEDKSAHICESCGADGKIRHPGWIKTLCDDCDNKRRGD